MIADLRPRRSDRLAHRLARVLPCALLLACSQSSEEQPRCGSGVACPDGATCVGQVCVPDEDPIVPPPATPGALLWARSLSSLSPLGVVENAGAVTLTGYFSAPLDLGAGVITPGGTNSAVIVLAAVDASYVSAFSFGGTGQAFGFLGAVDSGGATAPFVQGVSYGPGVDLGLGAVNGGGGPGADGFVGRYGGAAPIWVKRIVGPGEDKLVGTALQAGNLYAIGWFEGQSSFDGIAMTSSSGSRDIVLARMSPSSGQLDVTRVLGSPGRDEASAITKVGAELAASGFFAGTLALSGALSITSMQGSLDVWVSRLSLAGDPRWVVSLGGPGEERSGPIVSDPAGDLYLAGTFSDRIELAGVSLTSRGATDIFLVKLRGRDGAVVWATSLGSTGADSVASLILDRAGNLVLAATVAGELEPGGPFAGGLDACFASYDGAGNRRWLKILGTAGDDRGWSVASGGTAIYAGLSVATPLPDLGIPVIGVATYSGLLLQIAP